MHFKRCWFRRGTWIMLMLGLSLPASSIAHHEVHEAQQLIEESLKKMFDDFNKDDFMAFGDGWTDAGFMNKQMFRMHVDRPFPKDEIPVFAGAMRHRGPIELQKISNIRMLDHMMVQATAEIDLRQGHVREHYGLRLIKRMGLDKRYKIAKDELLPVIVPGNVPIVQVKMTEYAFEVDKSRLAREMVLQLVNAGKTPHEFILFQKIISADWEHSIARGAWALKPGQTSDLVLTRLEPGEYAIVCCNTQPGNEAHCTKGMRMEFALN